MATFNDDWFKRILFNNGEGLDYTDLNHAQRRFSSAFGALQFLGGVQDAILTSPAAASLDSYFDVEGSTRFNSAADVGLDLAWAPAPQAGFWEPSATANTLQFVPGPIAQVLEAPALSQPATATMDSPFIMGMLGTLGGAALTLATAVGDATNPRIDLVEVKLAFVDTDNTSRDFKDATTGVVTTTSFDKTRTVQVTYQIKQGTPAASPTYPTPTAGFVPMCAVWVPATHNAVHSIDNIRDMRMPMGRIRCYDVPAHLAHRYGASPWTLHQTDFKVDAGVGASFLYVACPTTSKNERLVAVGVAGIPDGSNDCRLQRFKHDGGIPTIVNMANLTPYCWASSGGGWDYQVASAIRIMDAIHTQGTAVGARATDSRIGSPFWCNGFTAGPAHKRQFASGFTNPYSTYLQFQGDLSSYSVARFYTVGGLF